MAFLTEGSATRSQQAPSAKLGGPSLAGAESAGPSPSNSEEEKARILTLFFQYRETGDVGVRDELTRLHVGVVRYVASRFATRGESVDDLFQVGCLGLMKAVTRFEPAKGFAFLTFAIPTISGEIRRHLRDHGCAMRVPRLLLSRWVAIDVASDNLTGRHGRSPTIGEIAASTGLEEEVVLEAQASRQARALSSLDALQMTDRDRYRVLSCLGRDDSSLEAVDDHETTTALLRCLSVAERRLVYLRFEREMSQRGIARELGVSQMQVSRMLARAIAHMRAEFVQDRAERASLRATGRLVLCG